MTDLRRELRLASRYGALLAAWLTAFGCREERHEPAPRGGSAGRDSPSGAAAPSDTPGDAGRRMNEGGGVPSSAGASGAEPVGGGAAGDLEGGVMMPSGGRPIDSGSAGDSASPGGRRDGSGGDAGIPSGAGVGGEGGVGHHAQGGSGGDAAAGSPSGTLPCDVLAVLEARCLSCHGSPPLHGAPLSLTSWSVIATYAATMQTLIEEDLMPPPGAPDLSEDEAATLVSYLSLGAPSAGDVPCP